MLCQHPQIIAPAKKELDFFNGLNGYDNFTHYHSMFPIPYHLSSGKITGEASPGYLVHPLCPPRIYNYNPTMKLIVILRDPVARAFSGWNMYRRLINSTYPPYQQMSERRSFTNAIMEELAVIEQTGTCYNAQNKPYHYVGRGMYAEQLRGYFQYFAHNNLLILEHNELLHNREACLSSVCQFLEIDAFDFKLERRNVSTYESAIPEETAHTLRSFYVPHNESLFQLLGRKFSW